jgi:adenylate cyclase
MRLDQIRAALEGAIPATMATCAPDGEPNVAFLSQVHYVDGEHVALSYQFFNKTRRNILANPQGQLSVVDPHTGRLYRMRLRYLRTESEGPLFERMKAHLEGIASHTGMAGVFRLLGSDIYRVEELEALPGNTVVPPAPALQPLAALRSMCEKVAACGDFGALVDTALDTLVADLQVRHAQFLVMDEGGQRLYTVGSRGYARSGIGAEIALGEGVIGVCAQARTPIRISWLTQAYRYSRAMREVVRLEGSQADLSIEIPYPGLADPHSQLGVPLLHGGRVLGVLLVESEQDLHFTYDHEDALVAFGHLVAATMRALGDTAPAVETAPAEARAAPDCPFGGQPQEPLQVRYHAASHSVFCNQDYVIKGVAGAILWRLLNEYVATGRTEFTNREIRLDPAIKLPDVVDNLEARLILLRRRLDEQKQGIALDKCGRGRLRLQVCGQLQLMPL